MKLNSAKTIVSSLLFTGMMAVPGIALAEDPVAVAGCGAGWELVSVDVAIGRIDDRIYPDLEEWKAIRIEVAGLDKNADEHLCVKQWKPNRGQDKHWGGGEIENYLVTGIKDNLASGRLR